MPNVRPAQGSRLAALAARRLAVERQRVVETLVGLRLDAGLSQSALARAAGVSRSYLTEIEAGRKAPSPRIVARLAAALGGELSLRVYQGTGPIVRDHLQVAMVEALLVLTDGSWRPRVEVPIPQPARGYADLLLHDPSRCQAIEGEFHSQLRRVEQQLRWQQAKAETLASTLPPDTEMSRLLVLRSTETNRRLIARDPHLFTAALPARAADAYAALRDPTTRWPGNVLLWATVEAGRARVLPTPPRGIRVGR